MNSIKISEIAEYIEKYRYKKSMTSYRMSHRILEIAQKPVFKGKEATEIIESLKKINNNYQNLINRVESLEQRMDPWIGALPPYPIFGYNSDHNKEDNNIYRGFHT